MVKISVDVALPKKDENNESDVVLLWFNNDNDPIATGFYNYESDEWFVNGPGYGITVTHWSPITVTETI